ncbi:MULTISPECIES: type II toxin-antitoxin system VapC family toxin [Sinorhizobium]|uniref:type II toxin-antitoxin system VapC family toxin n=1 Tax=Sinorhizobium TaxID=28105 RepID=UPI00055AA404|nr:MULTISPECIES: type II toxin-antitoxin system VapC family toxin [Sinorhizobium]
MPEPPLLLDTDIVSLMGRRRSPPGLRTWLLRVGIHRLNISYPVITELMRGAHLRQRDDPEKAARIMAWVNDILSTDFPIPPMSPEVAYIYAQMTSVPCLRPLWTVQRGEKATRMGHDLMIAAVAIAHGLPILTGNIRDYVKIHQFFPLPGVYQPMESRWHVPPETEFFLPRLDEMEGCRDNELLPML